MRIPLLFLLMSLSLSVWSQISIEASDILSLIGKSQMIEQDSSGTIAVDVGMAGENQTWDFSNIVLNEPVIATFQHTTPDGTPFEADFPRANMVQSITFPDFDASLYNYFLVDDDALVQFGNGFEFNFMGMVTSQVLNRRRTVADLPLTYGASWTEAISDTIEPVPGIQNITIDTVVSEVDAWGTVILPGGAIPVLRIRSLSKARFVLRVGGITTESTITETISYNWISKENLIVATATSIDNETNPDFNTASYFSRLVSDPTTPVVDVFYRPLDLEYFPNPFRDKIDFRFTLDEQSDVRFQMWDVSGRKIVDEDWGKRSAGAHAIAWTRAALLPAGTYLFQLTAGQQKFGDVLIKETQ